jgi:serine/threonine protein phosphatase PrpC
VHAYRSGPPLTRIAVAARSRAGAKHKSNLDAYLISDFEAYRAGDHASLCEQVTGRAGVALAVLSGHFLDWNRNPSQADRAAAQGFKITRAAGDALAASFASAAPPLTDGELRGRLAHAVTAAGHAVAEAAHDPRFIDTAASCTLAIMARDRLEVIQAGETRAYRMRDRRLEWISVGVRHGGVDASRPPPLGVPAPALPPLYSYDLRLGDTVVLCSRGVASTLEERRIEGILLAAASLEGAAQAMVEEAGIQRSEHPLTVVLAALLE